MNDSRPDPPTQPREVEVDEPRAGDHEHAANHNGQRMGDPEAPEQERRVEVHPGREVVVRFDPGRTFECVEECTWCCHHGVLLYEPDLYALSERADLGDATTTYRGADFVRREPKARDAHVGEDGRACHFLREDGRCGVQAAHDWKPTRCSVFPLSVTVEDGDLCVDVRESAETNCEGMDVSERRLIDHLDAFLPPVLWDLDDPTTECEL